MRGDKAPSWDSHWCNRLRALHQDALPGAEREAQENTGVDMVLASGRVPNGFELLSANSTNALHMSVFAPTRSSEEDGAEELVEDLRSTVAERNWREDRGKIPKFLAERALTLMFAHYEPSS